MGRGLAVLAVAVAFFAARIAVADKKQLARELFDQGVTEYKAKQYDAAIASMSKSYALDPQPDALYAWAQAERMTNNCKDALVHYQQLLDTTHDEKTATIVKGQIELCKQIETGHEDKLAPDATTVEKRDAPMVEIKTVYRTEHKTDHLTIGLFAGGGIAIGGSVALLIVAHSTRNDADHAVSLDEYNQLYDRAKHLRWGAYGAAAVGLTAASIAMIRVLRRSGETSSVAMAPVRGGSLLTYAATW